MENLFINRLYFEKLYINAPICDHYKDPESVMEKSDVEFSKD